MKLRKLFDFIVVGECGANVCQIKLIKSIYVDFEKNSYGECRANTMYINKINHDLKKMKIILF